MREHSERRAGAASSAGRAGEKGTRGSRPGRRRDRALDDALARIEREGGDGVVRLADDLRLEVRNLDKVYFADARRTKGDVMRYYARVAPHLLPLIADRPLILKRHPDGTGGKSFFQHEPPEDLPPGIRSEIVPTADRGESRRLVGGGLATLLYCVQLGAIAVNPWHARVGSLDAPDHAILDLDPGERVPFSAVVDVALRVREALEERGVTGGVKTSGASGIHVYVPLHPGATWEGTLAWARDVAEQVASASPGVATTARAVGARPAGSVYVDALQNSLGKSVAAPFSVRARPGATVSMPLAWNELEAPGLDPSLFTLDAGDAELAARARVWRAAMRRRYRID